MAIISSRPSIALIKTRWRKKGDRSLAERAGVIGANVWKISLEIFKHMEKEGFRFGSDRLVTDVLAYPGWRRDVRSVAWLPDDAGRRCFREVGAHGPMDLTIERAEPDRLFVTRIVTRGSPFSGTWTVSLVPDGPGTVVTVTEHGEVHNVVFRALARFVFGHTATIDGWLRALAARCGGTAEPGPAPAADPPAPR